MRLVTRLHQWDVLRANKAPFAFGLETRVPFLDKQFLQVGPGVHVCVWLAGSGVGWYRTQALLRTWAGRPACTVPPSIAGQSPHTSSPPLPSPSLSPQVAMNIDPRDKMPNLSEKPDGVHAKLEKYILRKVGLPDWLVCKR